MENLFGRRPQAILTDNGGEYMSYQIATYMQEKGIEHFHTVPYTPEQNAVAERKNQYVIEMVRCMLIDSQLPNKYWAEAVMTATYLQNRLSTKAADKTPFELWLGHTPNLKYIRIFGSKAYAFVPAQKRRKLDRRTEIGVLVGYKKGCKGYRIVNPNTGKLMLSSVVYFHEGDRVHRNYLVPMSHNERQEASDSLFIPLSVEGGQVSEDIKDVAQEKEATEQLLEEAGEPDVILKTPVRCSTRSNKGVPAKRLSYLAKWVTTYKPSSWKEIESCSAEEAEKWEKAAAEEFDDLKRNNTWTLTKLPKGKKKMSIGCKW